MGELSDRFGALMARMAKSDADLFRTLGEQSSVVRSMVEDLMATDEPAAGRVSLAPQGLLPQEDCELKALKARFSKAADAQAWAEQQLGPAPTKPTWAVLEQTFRTGAWPQKTRTAGRSNRQAVVTMQQLDERLLAFEQRLFTRLDTLEAMIQRLSRLPEP